MHSASNRAGQGGGGGGPGELAPPLEVRSTKEGWLQYYNHAMHRLVRGHFLMTDVLDDVATAVSALAEWTGVGQIGIAGHSYGGNVALFAAALDERIKYCCVSGAACSYRYKLAHDVGLEMALVIPGFAQHFDLDDLMKCVAPRPLFIVSSEDDALSADADDLVSRARPQFIASGGKAALEHLRTVGGHALDAERHSAIVRWLADRSSEPE